MIKKITALLLKLLFLSTPLLQGQIYSPLIDYHTTSPYPYSSFENVLENENLKGDIKRIKKMAYYSSSPTNSNNKVNHKFKIERDESFEIHVDSSGSIFEFNKLKADSIVSNTYYYKSGILDSYVDYLDNNVTTNKIYKNGNGKIEMTVKSKTGPYIKPERKDTIIYNYNDKGWLTSCKGKGQVTIYNYLQDTLDFERITYNYNSAGDSMISSKVNITYTDPYTKTFSNYSMNSDSLYLYSSGFEKYDSLGRTLEKTISEFKIYFDSLYLIFSDLEKYDSLGRIIEKEDFATLVDGSWSRSRSFHYLYKGEYLDTLKRIVKGSASSYSTFTYTRDSLGRLTKMIHNSSPPPAIVDGIEIEMDYVIGSKLKKDIVVDYEYDHLGNILSSKSSHNRSNRFDYKYDNQGNWISKLEYKVKGNRLIRKTFRQISYR